MKKGIWKPLFKQILMMSSLLIISIWFVSCKDEYVYDNKEPEWLGDNIYDYLKSSGNYTTFVKLIDDTEFTEVLQRTGSKTLFVADDAAFDRFYQGNEWGVTSYGDLSSTQKNLLLKFSMIDNAYLIETLANYYNGELQLGTALRRTTSISPIDTIPFESGNELPDNPWWRRFQDKGIHVLKNATSWPLVHFLQSTLSNTGISNDDFYLITSVPRENNDAHIFSSKVIERDIVCKNGYVHKLEEVLIPPVNLAERLRVDPETSIFSRLLERYSAPYYDGEQTTEYNLNHPDNTIDSIFEKRFFWRSSQIGFGQLTYPNGLQIPTEYLLPFDPEDNSYISPTFTASLQSDMAAMFVPTDNALTDYFENGKGSILKDRYGSWDNVPDDIIALFLKRHMRESFIESVPSRFDKLKDSENSVIPINKSDVIDSYVGLNGVMYKTSQVYPPDDYVSVYGPVLFSEKTTVFNWAVRQNDFRLYLNSLVSRYSFFVPTDEYFKDYIDPIAYAKDVKAALKYWYNKQTSTVNATVYTYDAATNTVGDSIGVITSTGFLSARLLDLLDTHIVIGDVESGSSYFLTKGGNTLKVQGTGLNLKVQGGDDVAKNVFANVIENGVYEQENGKTYLIDKPLQTPLRSVYSILSDSVEYPQFQRFFGLLDGFTGTRNEIFVRRTNYYGIDFNIKFFNTFNYSVYVPTNEAIDRAVQEGVIKDWALIDTISNAVERNNEVVKLERFCRYHFQDNSVFISGESVDKLYQTATIKQDDVETQFGTYKNKYYRIRVTGSGSDLNLSTENYGTAKVVTTDGSYNIMARDYVFSGNPQSFAEIDGSGTGTVFTSSSITTSSTAVIHQIDNVLRAQ